MYVCVCVCMYTHLCSAIFLLNPLTLDVEDEKLVSEVSQILAQALTVAEGIVLENQIGAQRSDVDLNTVLSWDPLELLNGVHAMGDVDHRVNPKRSRTM